MHVGEGGGQDVELNLAPIIDCFTVLITFLLATASFMSIGIFDAGIAAAGSETTQNTPPEANISVELSQTQDITIKIENKNGSVQNVNLAHNDKGWDFAAMTEKLNGLKTSFPDVKAVTLQAQTDVEYKNVIQAMEQIRKVHSVVMLGGF